MQTTMAVEDIKVTLPELLDALTPGDEVIRVQLISQRGFYAASVKGNG